MNTKLPQLLRRIPITLSNSSRGFQSHPKETNSLSPKRILAIGGLGLVGGLLAYYQFKPQKSLTISPDSEPISHLLSEAPPYNDKCRKIRYPESTSPLKITLYQYTTCPFCCKVRAFLDYFGINYDIVEVNSVFRKEIKWSPTYKKVPILVVETPKGEFFQLNDSTMIISALMTHLKDPSRDIRAILDCYPQVLSMDTASGKSAIDVRNKYFIMNGGDGVVSQEVKDELKWRKWVDSVFVHRISPNVYRSPSESLEAFRWFDMAGDWKNVFNMFERQVVIYLGASVMWILGKVLKKRHGIQDDVRESIYHEVNNYLAYVKKSEGGFGGGEKPNLADISFFGTLNSFEGCEAFQDILSNTLLKAWFTKMKWAVGSRAGTRNL